MHDNEFEGDERGMEFPANGVGTSFEADAEDALFGEMEGMNLGASRSEQQEMLEELFQSDELLNEGLLSFEYPLLVAEDEELDLFLGKLIRRARKAVSGVARGVGKTVGGVARTVGKGLSAIDKVVPVSMLTRGLSMSPLGMAVRAGVGAVQAAADGRNVFQGAMRSLADSPGTRFLVDTGMAAARGENIAKAAQKAMQAGIGDVRKSLQFAAMVAPFVPGVGTGVAAALGAANALASGQKITDALIAGARGAVPGGAIAQMAFDTAVNLARGKNVGEAFLNSARSRLPGGPAAQAAFDAALTLAKGKSIQDAAFAATGRLLPRSPYAADALSFVRKVAAGQNIQRAALSGAGNFILNKIQRQTGTRFPKAGARQAVAAARARLPFREVESFERPEDMPEADEFESFEAGVEDSVFGETEEMELAAQLLEITDENELDNFLGALIARATGGARRLAPAPHLRGLLRQAAKSVLPIIGGAAGNLIAPGVGDAVGAKLATAAGNLFGLELEGMSPEDQEFEVARRFVRFAGAGARNAARFRGSGSPKLAARRALGAAARRHAPGFLRLRKPRPPRGVRIGSSLPDYEPEPPIPIAVTCHCCGTPQLAPAPADTAAGADANPLPDNEPANSTEPQPKTPKETDMHDLDRTTMEISDEAGDFEMPEQYEYASQGESPFNQDEVEELAANLLEITDEQELDQFLGDLFRKAKSVVGGALEVTAAAPARRLPQGRHQEGPADCRRRARQHGRARPRRADRLAPGFGRWQPAWTRIRGPRAGRPGV